LMSGSTLDPMDVPLTKLSNKCRRSWTGFN
jgi:hypothetical protein